MAHASRAAHVHFRMRTTILEVCNSIYLHLLTHWCNCRKLTSFPGSAHTWLLLNDLVIEQRRALLLYFTKIRQKSRQAISFWSMQLDNGHAISSKFEERSCIWRSRARIRIFALTASIESFSCMNKLNPSNLLTLTTIKRSGGGGPRT